MNTHDSFSDSVYEEQTYTLKRELSAFIWSITESFGPEQAAVSERDWLDECDGMDTPPLSIGRNWSAVTIAASARLPYRPPVRISQETAKPRVSIRKAA